MDDEPTRHQQRLDEAGRQIDELDKRGNRQAAARLRGVHRRVVDDFARLRRAAAGDWKRMRADAQAGARELAREMGEVDTRLLGWYAADLATLDESLDDLEGSVAQTKDAGRSEALRARIAQARRRRAAIASASPDDEKAAVESYSAAVQDAIENWRKVS
jgi:hypothetical protein